MLSVILYGCNDSHGYNYHKRLAISLNCIGEMLSFQNDEIIFVDYNSPEDQPTIIEAVFDTLTEKVKSLIKLYRIRSSQRFYKNSALPGEPLCRNAAIRRTCPENKWILSTNIDMVFVPIDLKETLSTLVADLPEGFYQLPRFELPENLWESHFNRLNPQETLSFLHAHAREMQLNTIVRRPGFLAYDNPGDFQLMPRETIFSMSGFNEQMQKGWHLDANLCKRMFLYYNEKVFSLEGMLRGYHCNHNRQTSMFHAQFAPENNWNFFVKNVNTPYLSKQQEHWGLIKEPLEEIILGKPKKLYHEKNGMNPSDLLIDQDSFNTLTYHSPRIFTHLVDHFYYMPPNSQVVYIGHNQELLHLIEEQVGSVLTLEKHGSLKTLYNQAALMIFDFGFDEKKFSGDPVIPKHKCYKKLKEQLKDVMNAFFKTVHLEKRYQKQRKLIGINTLFTDYRALFNRHLFVHKTTYLTGISFGYVNYKKKKNLKKLMVKKQLKFFLMYLIVRYLYRFTDPIRCYAYRISFLKKSLQLK